MTREWTATCKDCGKEFGYSEASIRADEARGFSRPERCSNCRRLHGREIRTLGLAYYELRPVRSSVATTGIGPGWLGGLKHPPRDHKARPLRSGLNPDEFGIKNEDVKKLYAALRSPECQVAIVTGPTASGKSTFLPYRLMVPPEDIEDPTQFTRHGQIVVTQPRILATEGVAEYVAETLHGSKTAGAGYDIGFKYRNAPATDRRNRLVYVTDGTLLNWIVRGRLSDLSVIMIDEVHERNLNIDLILGLLKAQLPLYPHLKIIVASATISEGLKDRFVNYFGGEKRVAFLPFKGERVFDVNRHFHDGEPIPMGEMPTKVADKIVWLLKEMASARGTLPLGKGDILAFLHGVREIEKAIQSVRDMVEEDVSLAGRVDIYPLYRGLSKAERKKAQAERTDPHRFRVIVATNIAETSVTVDGIIYVVDSGLIKRPRWDPKAQTEVLESAFHSQAGCRQRRGRAGRTAPGEAYCLYTQEQFESFSPDTLPEIVRAPLEQIVLKAKAAGIDDVFQFDWVEPPDEVELRRSERVLRKWNALDDAGDLTEQGLEVHWIPQEPYLANLMIVADRLACAVEMATVLPMIELAGRRGLLEWDWGWDAATKHAVNRIHRGLTEGCRDDLEFCLKLFAAWEVPHGDENHDQAAWARHFFVNQDVMRNVAQERENLLRSLSPHKKSFETRPIDFSLLDRVRIAFATSLPERIYYRDSADLTPHGRPAFVYRPKFPADESVADATLEISQNSVCYGRGPELLVCASSRVFRRQTTPRAEPERVIDGSFLVQIRPEWPEYVGSCTLAVAELVSRETRDSDGTLRASGDRLRLFLDQSFPLGACYNCRLAPGDAPEGMLSVYIEDQVSAPPRVLLFSRDGEVELTDELDEMALAADEVDLGTLPPEVRAKVDLQKLDKVRKEAPLDPEADETPAWIEIGDEDDELHGFPERSSDLAFREKAERPLGLVPFRAVDPKGSPTLVAEVVGYVFDQPAGPMVLLRPRIEPEPFDVFAGTHQDVGDTVWVEAVAVERYPNDFLVALLVREEDSGLEVVMESEDLSIIGRGFAVEAIRPGQRFPVVVEACDPKRRWVRLSRLPFVEEDLLALMGASTELILPARIAEVRDDSLFVHLDPRNARDRIVHGGFVPISRLPHRPEASLLGKECRVKIRLDPEHKTSRGLPLLPDGLVQLVDQQHWGTHITCDVGQKTLTVEGRMTYTERVELLDQSRNVGYRRAINILYQRSNGPYVAELIDFERLVEWKKEHPPGKRVTGKVIAVRDNYVFVEIDQDLKGRVHVSDLAFQRVKHPSEEVSEGDEVEVLVKSVEPERGWIDLSKRLPEEDPKTKYPPNILVRGRVSGLESFGAFVELEKGGTGLVHISEISRKRIEHPREALKLQQPVTMRVLSVEGDPRKISLTIKRAYTVTMTIPTYSIGGLIGKDGQTINGIRDSADCGVEIDNDGTVTIWGTERQKVLLAQRKIRAEVPSARPVSVLPAQVVLPSRPAPLPARSAWVWLFVALIVVILCGLTAFGAYLWEGGLLPAALPSVPPTATAVSRFVTFERGIVSFEYPSNWEVITEKEIDVLLDTSLKGMSPSGYDYIGGVYTGGVDGCRGCAHIVVVLMKDPGLTGALTDEQYQQVKASYQNTMGPRLISIKRTELDGMPGVEVVNIGRSKETKLRGVIIVPPEPGMVYSLTCLSHEGSFDDFEDVFARAIETLHIARGAPATPSPAVITYTVQPGDTLAEIAADFGVTVEDIVEANDIEDPNLINVDQVLVIPKP